MAEQLLKLTNIKKSFAGVQALKGVNLTINKGEIHCLAGENGCGKSTLIKVISGVYTPDEGNIEIDGKEYKQINPIESIHEGIQVIYQDFSIFPNLTAAENIALNFELSKNKRLVNWKEVHKIAKEAIDKIGVNIDLSAKVETMSVAEKQLIAISRALLQNAKLIIMDEPTTALTQIEVKSLFKIIKGLQEKGISILFVSHKLDEVFEISERITILRNGRNVVEGDVKEFDRSKFIYYMTGKEIEENFFEPEIKSEQPLLKVDKLSLKNGFTDVSFELYPGEILGITGLLGSGRTELAMSLFGLRPSDSGEIYIEGRLTEIRSVQEAIKNRIGYVPEDRLTEGLCLKQSIGKNIITSTADKFSSKLKFLNRKRIDDEVNKWVSELNIAAPSPSVPVQTLSGGNQQRVVIAKWLATNPLILILNGPTVGVDVGSKSEIHNIVRNLAAQGVGIIIISDDIPEVLHNCNRVLIMKKGKIDGEYVSAEIKEDELNQKLTS